MTTCRRPPTFSPVLLAILLAACASPAGSGGGGTVPADEQPQILRGVEGTERIVQRGKPLSVEVSASEAVVWDALLSVFKELELAPTTQVQREGRLAAEGFRLVRLAGRRASYYVDCGSTLSGRVADEAQVLAGLVTAVRAQPGGKTGLAIRVDAEARARGGIEGVRECTSTGQLEALVLEKVEARLTGAQAP